MSAIYWFSGTGNSLCVAKSLSDGLSIPLHPMAQNVPPAVGGSGEKIGFVFPSYYGNLPRIVRAFVDNLEIRPGTYLFAIVTMGGFAQGSLSALKSALLKKGLSLDYGRCIRVNGNYVLKYNPADPQKSEPALRKAAERIRRLSADIAAMKKSVRSLPFTANNLYRNIASLDEPFFVEESCIACGRCEKICPVGNIQRSDGKPVWLHRCEHCVACISWCPVQAIQYGEKTKARRRYQNPKIKVDELLLK